MKNLEIVYKRYSQFLFDCMTAEGNFKFTKGSKSSYFSLIFGIFGLNLLREKKVITKRKNEWKKSIIQNLFKYKKERELKCDNLCCDKPFLQLLTFSLSALKILSFENQILINKLIEEIFPEDLLKQMNKIGVNNGNPGTGNFSMFYAIMILSTNKKEHIKDWVKYHKNSMNSHGFWGSHLNHLSFQNGYHQYEIFKYLNIKIDSPLKDRTIKHIVNCSDSKGHFAPYPGGGACFDYDAVFLLDYLDDSKNNESIINIFKNLKNSLLTEQNSDGGFSENKYVRPFQFTLFFKSLFKSKSRSILFERLKHFIFLLRPKNSLITNHWCDYSREWDESNLWDSWFRVQTLIIIESYLNPRIEVLDRFIDFPGIGFRNKK